MNKRSRVFWYTKNKDILKSLKDLPATVMRDLSISFSFYMNYMKYHETSRTYFMNSFVTRIKFHVNRKQLRK